MNLLLSLLDGLAVMIFGSVLSASFCNALNTRRNRWIFWLSTAAILLCQGSICFIWDDQFLRLSYPLVTHLPMVLMLYALTGTLLWPIFSVFTAYLCCQLRRWLALLMVTLLTGGPMMLNAIQIAITLPLLFLLLRFAAPSAKKPASYSWKRQLQFGMLPALYYAFDYLTVIYTDLLSTGNSVVVEFMPFVCCTAYLVFLFYHSDQEEKKFRMLQVQNMLNIQVNQSVHQINMLRESQALTQRYRHDLRHHLQYLSACMEAGQFEQAQSYITGICREVEAQAIQYYCENEAANLILSSFAGRAEKAGIAMKIQGSLPARTRISDSDLCVLLSNALENAIHACLPLIADGAACDIDVQFFEQTGKFFLQVTNPFREALTFENGVPVSNRPEHGIGVQSICAIVQQYGGMYSFTAQDDRFIVRLSM